MKKAIWSKVWLNSKEEAYAVEFNECIKDLLEIDEVKQLETFYQHLNTSRLQHSINVAYYSFLICKKLGYDFRSAARAGILHDLFLYDWRDESSPEGWHPEVHPKVALENAKRVTELNAIEEDAIVKHMWPMTIKFPKYKESYVVTMVDKYCACAEIMDQGVNSVLDRSLFLKCMVAGGIAAR